ncbi:MAG: glycosyltransferase [Streptococcaceae bacterium]|jgi:glycosyltransferase involved in cell wall biosynthesis|nr:glycosyltransferase [Streptococcaceae bacterium]
MTSVSIIIPFKDQTEKELSLALASINGQIGVDFSEIDVQLVNDGGAAIEVNKFEIFSNLRIHYHELPENVGPGLARQYGIDHSESDYLMFIDADDELHYTGALLDFFNVLKESASHQIIIGKYIEQYLVAGNEFRYQVYDYNWKALYAKCFQRDYLKQLNLHFHPKLRLFEDMYFVGLACELATDIHYLNSVVYSWLFNANSLVRSGGRSYEHQTHLWVKQCQYHLEFLQKAAPERLNAAFENYLVDIYFRSRAYPPEDEKAFWQAHCELIKTFSQIWQPYNVSLQLKADKMSQETPMWKGKSPEAFEVFMKETEQKLEES